MVHDPELAIGFGKENKDNLYLIIQSWIICSKHSQDRCPSNPVYHHPI